MMDTGPQDPKRPRLNGHSPASWQSPDPNRNILPPINQLSRPELQTHNPLDRAAYEHHPQDLRRSSSGPQHQPFYPPHTPLPQPPYSGPREPNHMVKRDPSDEPPAPPYQRPPSTGNGPDHNANHPPHHEQPRIHYDPTRPQPYQQHQSPDSLRSGSYQQNSYPPTPNPNTMPASNYNPYQNNGLPTQQQEPYTSVTYPSSSSAQRGGSEQIRKKAQRAAQACDSCRTLKAKCDEGRPSCTTCKEKGVECKYKDPPPKQQDKQTADIMDSFMRLEAFIKTKFEFFQTQMDEVRRTQQMCFSNTQRVEPSPKQEADESSKLQETMYSMPSVVSETQTFPNIDSPYALTPGLQRMHEKVEQVDMLLQPRSQDEDDEEDTVGAPRPAGDPTMPINHTTGAARLLLVRPIREMCKEIMAHAKIKNEMFPIVTEERRGLLRVYGRGEGHDSSPAGYERDSIVDHGAEHTPDDAHSNVSSPGPGDEWGQVGGFTPPASHEYPPRDLARSEINSLGMPDFSPQTVFDLLKSYKENMNNMHPILAPRKLDDMVETFLKSIQEDKARPRQLEKIVATHARALPAGFVNPSGVPESPGNKRKRSSGGDYPDMPGFQDSKPGHPNRTMTSCVVLLCMALGKICLYHSRLPDYESEEKNSETAWASPVFRNGYPPSPLHHSSPSMSTPIMMGSPPDMERVHSRSRRTSIEGVFPSRSTPRKQRNIDIIPGLVYYAMATDIIGNQLGGNDLLHVQANILASLYQGQLGRVMESHGFLAAACRAIQVQLRARMDRFKKIKESTGSDGVPPHKDSPLLVAFWTCLQLESDILAELPVPHSNILTYEEDMPLPNLTELVQTDGFDVRVIESYNTQLMLRKHLNTLHKEFYKPENDTLNLVPSTMIIVKTLEDSLQGLIDNLPHLKWDVERADLARDILGSRLRAKCYGAQVITYRPFIMKILESPVFPSPPGDLRNGSLSHVNLVDIPKEYFPKVMEYARKGIWALINSTRAFYGLGGIGTKRLIVTNVWGTAHAQWGNMMVLQAVYMNSTLRPLLLDLITLEDLKALYRNTMAFLNLHATKTSALMIDWRILENTGKKTGLYTSSNPTSSFGSTPGDISMSGH